MIGVDAVDVERLREVLARTKGAEDRLFTEVERDYCRSRVDPARHFAGTLAVKEAVIKAARLGPLVAWCRRIEVVRDGSGAPKVRVLGSPGHRIDVSISHDGPVAVAVAVAKEPRRTEPRVGRAASSSSTLRPNEQLVRYMRPSLPTMEPARQVIDHMTGAVEGTDFP